MLKIENKLLNSLQLSDIFAVKEVLRAVYMEVGDPT